MNTIDKRKVKVINWLIKVLKVDANKISDGYHTIGELYEHRIELWIAYCQVNRMESWKSKKHSDGSVWKGWFILGYRFGKGEQITYHLPIKYWRRLKDIRTIKPPKFDGHSAKDVIKRLRNL